MFKNIKLSTKLYLGFGILVVIAGVLEYIGFNGVNSIKAQMDNQTAWAEVDVSMAEHLTQSLLHLDMAIDEFKADKTKEAEENILTAYDHAVEGVDEWRGVPLVTSEKELKEITARADQIMAEYNELISDFISGVSTQNMLREQWDGIINECLVTLETTMIDVIDPAKDGAFDIQDMDEISKWGDIDMIMNEGVIANVLKLQTASHDYA